QVEPWRFGDDEPTEVTVRVDADHVAVSRPRFGRDATWTANADGSADVTCTVRGRRAFRDFVLSMLDHAVIVSPPEIRSWFVESLGEVGR
ncbi:MAG: WYL domain-containing protein, partial [Actinobacteria bacterium]|nr:WYL domain-containing protein [Actinomycetota bacterium]